MYDVIWKTGIIETFKKTPDEYTGNIFIQTTHPFWEYHQPLGFA